MRVIRFIGVSVFQLLDAKKYQKMPKSPKIIKVAKISQSSAKVNQVTYARPTTWARMTSWNTRGRQFFGLDCCYQSKYNAKIGFAQNVTFSSILRVRKDNLIVQSATHSL